MGEKPGDSVERVQTFLLQRGLTTDVRILSGSTRTFLDPDLQRFESIWAAAGSPHAVFRMTPGDLEQLSGGRWIELADD